MANKTDPTLVRITPRPVRSPGIDDPDEVPSIRRLDCRNYDGCLDIAIENRWPGFTCNGCPGYQQQTPAEAKRDYFATLNFLAERRSLLQQLRVATFRTDSLADHDLGHDDEKEPDGAQLRFGFADAGPS